MFAVALISTPKIVIGTNSISNILKKLMNYTVIIANVIRPSSRLLEKNMIKHAKVSRDGGIL